MATVSAYFVQGCIYNDTNLQGRSIESIDEAADGGYMAGEFLRLITLGVAREYNAQTDPALEDGSNPAVIPVAVEHAENWPDPFNTELLTGNTE